MWEAQISSCKASCKVRRVDIEPKMVVVRFYYLLTKKVRRVKFSIHYKKLFFLLSGWLCGPAQPFSLPLPFCPPLLTCNFFSDFEGPWSSASTKTEIFVSSPLFPVCLSFSSFPPPPFSPSLHLLSQPGERCFALAQKKKLKKNYFGICAFHHFFSKTL